MGNIAPGILYRSSSPIDPKQGDRRFVADKLLKEVGVATVVNTSDCRFRYSGFEGYDATNYAKLDSTDPAEKRIVALNMGHDYPSDAFLEDVHNGLDFMSEYPGPYLVHGTQGVERTGYVCMVLEALLGASKEELVEDYMRSYADYYQLERGSESWNELAKQAVNNLLTFTGAADETALDSLDLVEATRTYLLEKATLTPEQVELLIVHLSGK